MTAARSPGCTCSRSRRLWSAATGLCTRCGNRVLETQIMDAVRAVLVADPACLIWRNELGATGHFPDGTQRKHPIRYGVCNPGGADLLGLYGPRFLAVECKTVRGAQSPEQIDFERWITARGGVYALVRSESGAADLLTWLRAGAAGGDLPTHLRGEGGTSTPTVQSP